jgi:Tfp pilus assembly protein PilV
MIKRGFTLIEVLVAGGILFLVGASVVGLTNNIIQGTQVTSDKTAMNLWAQEGIEIVKKIRDDSNLNRTNQTTAWLDQATDVNKYGWYYLDQNSILVPLSTGEYNVKDNPSEANLKLSANELTGYRLICFEAVGSAQVTDDPDNLYCNHTTVSQVVNDGDRSNLTDCQDGDVYCAMTKDSINVNSGASGKIIPPGSALKVRSVVFWYDKSVTRTADVSTLLTNWQWSGNVLQ